MSGARVTGPEGGADIHEVTERRLIPRPDRMTAALFHLLTHPTHSGRASTEKADARTRPTLRLSCA